MLNHLSDITANRKLGMISTTTASHETCPKTCPFYGKGCYAETGVIRYHWGKVTRKERGNNWNEFIDSLKKLPKERKIRLNQAGDLPGKGTALSIVKLKQLVSALKGKKAWTYTHKPLYKKAEKEAIKQANKEGLTINLSANNLKHADELFDENIAPVATVIPFTDKAEVKTPKGRKVIVCPAQRKESVICESCMLCHKQNRNFIVGFIPHGIRKNKVNAVANQ